MTVTAFARVTLRQPASIARPAQRVGVVRIAAPRGADAALQQRLRVEQPPPGAGWIRRSQAWRARCRPRVKGALIGVIIVLAVFLSAFAANLDLSRSSAHEQVGASNVALADDDTVCATWIKNKSYLGLHPFHFLRAPFNGLCHFLGTILVDARNTVLDKIKSVFWSILNENKFCNWRVSLAPEDPDHGVSGMLTYVGNAFRSNDDEAQAQQDGTSDKATLWQKYGAAGLTWNTYFLNCYTDVKNYLANFAANFILGVGEIFAVIAIVLFEQTFNGLIIDYFLNQPASGGPSEIDRIMGQLNAQIYMQFASLAIVIGGAVLFWRGIVQGKGASAVISKFLIMCMVSGFALFFFTAHDKATGIVQEANKQVNDVGGLVMQSLVGTDCKNSGGIGGDKGTNIPPYACAAETMYQVILFYPWASGNLGVFSDKNATEKNNKQAAEILAFQAYSRQELADIKKLPEKDQGDALDKLIKAKKDNRREFVTNAPDDKNNPGLGLTVDGQKFKEDNTTLHTKYWQDAKAKDQGTWELWSGHSPGLRLVVAILGLFAMTIMAALMVTASIVYLVLELLTVVLLVVLPLALLIGLVPDVGVKVLLRWLEIMASAFVKRLAVVVFISAFVAGFRLVYMAGEPWWLQILTVIGLIIAGIAYRGKLTSLGLKGVTGGPKAAAGATLNSLGMKQRGARNTVDTWKQSRGDRLGDRITQIANKAAGSKNSGGTDASNQGVQRPSGRKPTDSNKPHNQSRNTSPSQRPTTKPVGRKGHGKPGGSRGGSSKPSGPRGGGPGGDTPPMPTGK